MNRTAAELRETVERAALALLRITEQASRRRPAAGKWSPKEIVGHLIDSACNNHSRFVRAQLQEDLVFPGCQQDEWVRLQRYQETPWKALINFWRDYNLHLSRVIDAAPKEQLRRKRPRHNLHQIAWKTVPEEQAATLEYFIDDYVGHLKHHLRQILAEW